MMPSLSDEMTATITSLMMIIMAGIGKNAVFFRICLTENPIERIEYD
jgi:hypothetical protein